MKITEFKYDGKTYEFRLTMASKKKINELQYRIFDKIQNPEIFGVMANQQEMVSKRNSIEGAIAKAKKDGNTEEAERIMRELESLKANEDAMLMKLVPQMKDYIGMMEEQVDPEEVAVILLMNNRAYKDDMTEELAYKILGAMEDEYEFVKYNEVLADIVDKVFTTIGLVKDNLDVIMEKVNKPKNKIEDKTKLMN